MRLLISVLQLLREDGSLVSLQRMTSKTFKWFLIKTECLFLVPALSCDFLSKNISRVGVLIEGHSEISDPIVS